MRSLSLILVLACVFLAGHVAFASKLDMDKAPVDITSVDDKWIQIGLEIIAIVLGLVVVFAGYRLFKLILFIVGFIIFYYICFHVLKAYLPTWAPFWVLLISAGSGILGGFFLLGLGLAAFKIAAFVLGFFGGSAMAYLALAATPLAGVIKNVSPAPKWEMWIVIGIVLAAGLVLGIISAIISRVLLIIITACAGAFVVGTAVDGLAIKPQDSILLLLQTIISSGHLPTNLVVGWEKYLILAGVVVLAVAGMVVQFRGTAKHYHHRHGYHGPAEYRPLLSVQDNY